MKISASLLNADHAFLGDAAIMAEKTGADKIHLDVTDGHYVSNISFGPKLVTDLKKRVKIPIEVHLEVDNPYDCIDLYARAGADNIIVQLDCCTPPLRIFNKIRSYNLPVGLAVNIEVGIEHLKYIARYLDYILIMSVEPGFGGQPFHDGVYRKIAKVNELLLEEGLKIPIGVDGGINNQIAQTLKLLRVDEVIIGSYLFDSKDEKEFENRIKLIKIEGV